MNNHRSFRRKLLAQLIVNGLFAVGGSAFAADATDLGTVGTQATGAAVPESKAAAVAPTQASLDATEPQSIINRSFIESSKSPVSDYAAVAAIAPSVTLGISANGPGLGETKNGIRGFKDGEFNVTWDGIPFGDTNGPTHHSTAYFPAEAIGSVVVDRGPGNASTLGQATFGGTMALYSRELANEQTIAPYYAYGTWNTQLVGARYDSGILANAGDAKFAVNYQKETSDGYRTNMAIQGENFNFKFQRPLGDSTLLTINTNFNKNWYYQNDKESGLTAAEVAQYGKNYALGTDPTKANYFGYNFVQKTTAMNYVRLESNLGSGWGVDDTAYYYNYTNNGWSTSATDLTLPGTGNVKTATGATVANQMPGYLKTNEYWVAGNIFKATKQLEAGLARVGLWAEKADTHRGLLDYNRFTGLPNYDQAAVAGAIATINNVKYEQNSGWKLYQPFAEFEWAATEQLKVTPGIKYMHTQLTIDALVNQTARLTQNIEKDFNATLPFLTANYKLSPTWSTYAQYAKGMLVPDISSYQSTNANATSIDPQRSTNYQWGIVHKSDRLTFDTDLYYIDFDNKIAVVPGTTAQPIYYNQGGVIYKGVEGELTYAFDNGFSAYVNGSINRAASKATGLQIANVPDSTEALGLLYNQGGWSASLMYKRVGRTYALDNSAYAVDPYSTTDLNVGYTFAHPGWLAKKVKVQLGIFNLFNKQDVITATPTNSDNTKAVYGQVNAGDTFLFQPARSVMASVRAEF